jgi:vacuolar protein sorting-associated protein 29
MIRCLAIGDSHIPKRAKEVSYIIIDKLNELTKEKLLDYIFFTGDLIDAPDFFNFLNLKTKNSLLMVMGNMDYYYDRTSTAPIYRNLDLSLSDNDKLIIGLTHGAQIEPRGDHSQLELLAVENKSHILISGHTHKEDIYLTEKGILLINPGSVTGAWSFMASGIPSFITFNIDNFSKKIYINLFQLDNEICDIKEVKSFFLFKNKRIISY